MATILKKGSKGEEVRKLQQALHLYPDGIFGPLTEEAVKQFQKENGLVVDGIAGPKTLEKLYGKESGGGNTFALKKSKRKIRKIIVHCSATPEGKDYTVAQIRQWHLQRGFSDIGYHYVIYRDGSLHEGRDVNIAGAHTTGQNYDSIGICYIGGMDKDNKNPKDTRTDAQKKTLKDLVKSIMKIYSLKATDVYGHYQFANKACPSFKIELLRKDL